MELQKISYILGNGKPKKLLTFSYIFGNGNLEKILNI